MKYQRNAATIAFIGLFLILLYVTAYFETTEIFQGQMGKDVTDFRLFNSKTHYLFFIPIIKLEEVIRTKESLDYFFYGHIKNGASLPPER